LGTRDYIKKNHFPQALIGLSGGIDSALALAIAVDAIGKEQIHAIMMPTRFTSDLSLRLAEQQAAILGVKYSIISIETIFTEFLKILNLNENGVTSENLQARARGIMLMAISNHTDAIVLTTGNKSEMAVGYSTLYGDMAGGFAILKDVYKTLIYQLSHYLNQKKPTILPEIIQRPPSAELAPHQTDQDILPPYEILDEILKYYIEKDESLAQITAKGFDSKIVEDVIRRVHRNEYKRKQSPLGIKITPRAFGTDWRYPVT
jgi:NAD+ synthase (glutamine-hydrolysing)